MQERHADGERYFNELAYTSEKYLLPFIESVKEVTSGMQVLEIGCGKGEYTVGLSQLYPEKNFIGIDIKGARMWHGAKTALEKGLSNAVFLRIYAEMLESVFAPCEISEIWITFPDPQMAKARKRLTGSRFLNLYKKILIPNGLIHLKTDSPFLFTYTTELIRQNQLKAFVCTADLYQEEGQNKILGIQTFYEQQWLSRGKTIKYLQFSLCYRVFRGKTNVTKIQKQYRKKP